MNKLKFALGVSIITTCLSTTALVYSNSGKIITAEIKADYVTNVDGVKQTFLDANGNEVFPILYEGSTYIPLRAVGNLMDKEVGWDATNKVIDLNTKVVVSPGITSSSDNEYIGEEAAKAIALSDAGITDVSAVNFITVKFEIDDRIPEYSIEFYIDNKEYDYEIHAATGVILEKDMDIENYTIANSQSNSVNGRITEEEAKAIAVNHAGQNINEISFIKVDYDIEKGVEVYEIEWKKDGMEYDYTINASNGNIVEYDIDRD